MPYAAAQLTRLMPPGWWCCLLTCVAGYWKGTLVAVKTMMFPAAMSGKEKREKMAIMETAISASLSHPNIVQVWWMWHMIMWLCSSGDQKGVWGWPSSVRNKAVPALLAAVYASVLGYPPAPSHRSHTDTMTNGTLAAGCGESRSGASSLIVAGGNLQPGLLLVIDICLLTLHQPPCRCIPTTCALCWWVMRRH